LTRGTFVHKREWFAHGGKDSDRVREKRRKGGLKHLCREVIRVRGGRLQGVGLFGGEKVTTGENFHPEENPPPT